MSCNGFEKGSVQLPTKEWKSFRDRLYEKYNYHLGCLYKKALRIHKEVSELKKGKRNFPLERTINKLIEKYCPDNLGISVNYFSQDKIKQSLFKDNKLVKPKKQDFKALKPTKDLILEDSDLSIKIDNKTRTVYYTTDDNNHSVDYARNSFLGKAFFILLDRVKFTSKTGGYLKSETEYDEDENGFSTGPRVTSVYGKYKTSKKYRNEILGR